MRTWAWLLPCWIWKYFFAQLPREQIRLNGHTRYLVRVDDEYAVVYDPQRTLRMGEPKGSGFRFPL